ncbi:MAG TPA: RNase adapter RapZ [Acidobacteriaceae bacterium]|nr:RNase adapter RapZ [Acidobacteriaceae bacterium]
MKRTSVSNHTKPAGKSRKTSPNLRSLDGTRGATLRSRSADHAKRPLADNELVILTGLSGSGKLSALKAFEDLGYYSVDNLPIDLIPPFADLIRQSPETNRAALVVDVREGPQLDRFPGILRKVRQMISTRLLFLEASDSALLRRFSETRRPHPLGRINTIRRSVLSERKLLEPLRNIADVCLDTTNFNVHELRTHINGLFQPDTADKNLLISTISFGYKNGVPQEADLVFDVRFLPNPHFVPEFRPLTGRDAKVVRYIEKFPETKEFVQRVQDLLLFLLPHYVQEGKSYLSVAFGCTGGQHRSVMISEKMQKLLQAEGYHVKTIHRDMPR